MWCLGINRFIFHTYAHQPWLDKVPGMTMGQWGTHFGRTNTWWEQSKPWMQYIARSQYLLQQGHTVADVLFFAGEAAPERRHLPAGTQGQGLRVRRRRHRSDHEALGQGRADPHAGRRQLPHARAARHRMDDARAGEEGRANWSRPGRRSWGRSRRNRRVWPTIRRAMPKWPRSPTKFGERRRANMRLATERSLRAARSRRFWPPMKVKPDFAARRRQGQARLHPSRSRWRRTSTSSPIRSTCPRRSIAAFRVTGRLPELWDAETGAIQPAPMWRVEDGRTIVTLNLEQAGSVFVVFRQAGRLRRPIRSSRSRVRADAAARKTPKLEIRKAVYGDFSKPDGGKVDVTAKLAELVKDGELEVTADNDLAGDPAVQRRQAVASRLRSRRRGQVDHGCREPDVAIARRGNARHAARAAFVARRRATLPDCRRSRPLHRDPPHRNATRPSTIEPTSQARRADRAPGT